MFDDFEDYDAYVDDLVEAIIEILEDGPVPMIEVLGELDVLGLLDPYDDLDDEVELGRAVRDALAFSGDRFWSTPDDVMVLASTLMEGLVLTHRLSADEIEAGEVRYSPDLVVLDFGADHLELEGADGIVVHRFGESPAGEDHSTLVGPAGWLDGFAAGDLVAFTRTGGTVAVTRAKQPADDEHEVALLRDTIDGRIGPGDGEDPVPFALDAFTRDIDAFRRPVRPLGELLEAAGLERRGFSFGRAGEDWKSFSEQFWERRRARTVEEYGLDGCCGQAFDRVYDAYEAFRAAPEAGVPDVRAVAEALEHSSVGPAVAACVLGKWSGGGERLQAFAEAVVAGVPRRAAPARLVLALEAERRGDALTAEFELQAALEADPGYGPVALEMADYAIDRSDLDRAITLLRHPDLSSDLDEIAHLEAIRAEARARYAEVGRNDRCPCGSGRKFKVCCQTSGATRGPLTVRTRFLFQKLVRFLGRPHRSSRLIGIASSACDPDDPDLATAIGEYAADPVIIDFTVFDGGVIDEYLDERGHLLPDDERDLLERLAVEPRRLWEVTEVEPGEGLTLRDTGTGDVVEVTEHRGSLDREPGELALTRVVPVDDEFQMIAVPVSVPLKLRDSAIDLVDAAPDADALADWYGRATAVPQLSNQEGERMVFCRVEFAGNLDGDLDGEEVAEVLDGLLERSGDAWHEFSPEPERLIRGTVRREGDRLVVETNSDERMVRLVGRLIDALPGFDIVSEERRDAREEILRRRRDPEPEELDLSDTEELESNPEVQALLDERLREMEAEWVDTEIPALGGLTPRQALDDPTRREDLVALLREFDAVRVPGAQGFDADRIRALLGLEQAEQRHG